MNIIATAAILITTLLGVPAYSYFFGTALGPVEIEALRMVAYIAAGSAIACFVIGELTDNVSQVDKVWSVLPVVYVWIIACYGDYSPRLLLMALLATVWGIRLTFNFSRHGAYQWKFWGGHEDYRWGVLRQRPEFEGKWRWSLFNFAFISGYQNALILLFTLPMIVALQNNQAPLNALDFIAAGLMLCFIVFETIADNQQWQYQSKKWSIIKSGELLSGDYKKGFLDKGLWAYSRHPNYFAEQSNWICFYLLSVAASGQWFNWSVTGCLLLMIMFRESSKFSEETSAAKYPEYVNYQNRVPRFIPFGMLFK